MMNLPRLLKGLLFLLFTSTVYAQPQSDFSEIDEHARQTPSSKTKSVEQLASYLTQDAETDLEKVRAFFVWISENVRYDVSLYFDKKATNEEKQKKQQPEQILKSKKAVCEGYSNLFHELCLEADIGSEKVTGFTRYPGGRINRNGHAWNAVQINSEWYLLDNTWGAGYVDPEKRRFHQAFQEDFFLVPPEAFVLDHFPNDPLFQMLPKPVLWEHFEDGKEAVKSNLIEESDLKFANIQDSLNYFHSLDKGNKVLNSCNRILKTDPNNGYANYTLANYYYTLASQTSEVFQEEFNRLMTNPRNVENKHLKKWDALLEESKENCRRSIQYLKKIQVGSKFYALSKSAKRNAESALRSLGKGKKQVADVKAFLKKIR